MGCRPASPPARAAGLPVGSPTRPFALRPAQGGCQDRHLDRSAIARFADAGDPPCGPCRTRRRALGALVAHAGICPDVVPSATAATPSIPPCTALTPPPLARGIPDEIEAPSTARPVQPVWRAKRALRSVPASPAARWSGGAIQPRQRQLRVRRRSGRRAARAPAVLARWWPAGQQPVIAVSTGLRLPGSRQWR